MGGSFVLLAIESAVVTERWSCFAISRLFYAEQGCLL